MATVDQNIASAIARIDLVLQQGLSFVDTLQTLVDTELELPLPGQRAFNIVTGTGLLDAVQAVPARPDDIDFVSPGNVADPPLTNIRDVDDVVLPNAPTGAPTINIPAAPDIVFPVAPTQPFIDTVTAPAAPTVNLPTTPTLDNITIPAAPTLQLPTFTQQFPEEELPFTPIPFSYSEPEFMDELLDEIKDQTISDLVDGGFGIDPRDEEQLVGRLRDRESRAGRTRESQVLRNFGSRGHHLPSGALDDALREAQFETQATISAGEREIYVTRADLFRRTREFMLTNGLNIVQFLGNLFSFRQERQLKAAQFASEIAITIFDAVVRRYNAQVAAFEAAARAHELLIRGELAKIEIFKAEIDAQRLIGDLNQQAVELYTAQINAERAIIDIFEAETRAAAIRADIERLKIQAFGEQINAFNSLVNAERSRIELFIAQIRGEQAKLDVYRSEVAVYGTEVEAARVKTVAQNLNVQSDIERNRFELQRYEGQIRQFEANLRREVERIRAVIDAYQADTTVYTSFVNGWKAYYDSIDRNTQVFLGQINADAQIDVAVTELELKRIEKEAELKIRATEAGVKFFQEVLQAAEGANGSIVVKEDVNA